MNKNKMGLARTETIRVRTSITEKESIEKNASKRHLSTSAYMRKKSLTDNSSILKEIPKCINIWNLSNDIYHAVEKHGNEQLTQDIKNILNYYLNSSKEDNTNE